MPRLKLGELLIEQGLIDAKQLASALVHQKRWDRKLGRCLLDLGYIKEKALYETLSKSLNIPIIDLGRIRPETITKGLLKCVPTKVAKDSRVIPLAIQKVQKRDRLIVATPDPLNFEAIRLVRFSSPLPLFVMIAPESDVDWFIQKYYGNSRNSPDYISVVQMKSIGQDPENLNVVESIFEDSLFDSNTKVYPRKKD